MRKRTLAAVALSLAATVSSASASDVKVKLINKSSYEIHELYVSPTKTNEWGPDQLQNEVIEKSSSFELRNIPVGKYDFKIVDEDGDECVVSAVKVAADEDVELNDTVLVGCQAATADEGGEEE